MQSWKASDMLFLILESLLKRYNSDIMDQYSYKRSSICRTKFSKPSPFVTSITLDPSFLEHIVFWRRLIKSFSQKKKAHKISYYCSWTDLWSCCMVSWTKNHGFNWCGEVVQAFSTIVMKFLKHSQAWLAIFLLLHCLFEKVG